MHCSVLKASLAFTHQHAYYLHTYLPQPKPSPNTVKYPLEAKPFPWKGVM